MLRTQTEAWPSVMCLSPVSGDLLPLSPTWHKKHRLFLSCWQSERLWWLSGLWGAGVVLMTCHSSLLMIISNLPPLTLCQSFICPFYLSQLILKGTILWLLVLVSYLFSADAFNYKQHGHCRSVKYH